MWRKKIKSLWWDVALLSANVFASTRWAYGEHQSTLLTMLDEVNVCVLSAVYSFWPLSRGAPLDTYGGNLFEFFSRERNRGSLGFRGLKFSLRGWHWVGGLCFRGCRVLGFLWEMPIKELQVRFQCFLEVAASLWHRITRRKSGAATIREFSAQYAAQ